MHWLLEYFRSQILYTTIGVVDETIEFRNSFRLTYGNKVPATCYNLGLPRVQTREDLKAICKQFLNSPTYDGKTLSSFCSELNDYERMNHHNVEYCEFDDFNGNEDPIANSVSAIFFPDFTYLNARYFNRAKTHPNKPDIVYPKCDPAQIVGNSPDVKFLWTCGTDESSGDMVSAVASLLTSNKKQIKIKPQVPYGLFKDMIPAYPDIARHGCWCSSLGQPWFPQIDPVDAVDNICRDLLLCHRCTRDSDHCQFDKPDWETSFSATGKFNEYQCDSEKPCTNNLCQCSLRFVEDIQKYLIDARSTFKYGYFNPDEVTKEKCKIAEDFAHNQDVSKFGHGGAGWARAFTHKPEKEENTSKNHKHWSDLGMDDFLDKPSKSDRKELSKDIHGDKGQKLDARSGKIDNPLELQCCGEAPNFRLYNPTTESCPYVMN